MKGRKSSARAVDYDSAAIDKFIYDHGYTNESFGRAVGLSAGTIELIRRAEYTSAPAVAKVEEFIRGYSKPKGGLYYQPEPTAVGPVWEIVNWKPNPLMSLNTNSRFYRNCKRQRKNAAKICFDCPFRASIEEHERTMEKIRKSGGAA